MERFTIVADTYKLSNFYGVYIVYDSVTAKIIYIGMEKMTQLFTMGDAKSYGKYAEVIGMDKPFFFQLVSMQPDKASAINEHNRLIRQHGMPDMIKQRIMTQGVLCVDTGERFRTAKEAAEAHGVAQGNLSKHLRGVPGYRSIRGKTYIKC